MRKKKIYPEIPEKDNRIAGFFYCIITFFSLPVLLDNL